MLEHLRQTLNAAGAEYAILEHAETVVTAEEGAEKGFGDLTHMAPTLVLRNETGYLVAVIGGERRLSYKKIKKALGLKDVSMATAQQVQQVTGAPVGAVSLVNPGLRTIVDLGLTAHETVFGGCGVERHTLRIRTADLIVVTQAQVFDFTEPKGFVKGC